MEAFLSLILGGAAKVIEQWVAAGPEERAAIEARAQKAVEDMTGARTETGKAHDERTAATEEAIKKGLERDKTPAPSDQ